MYETKRNHGESNKTRSEHKWVWDRIEIISMNDGNYSHKKMKFPWGLCGSKINRMTLMKLVLWERKLFQRSGKRNNDATMIDRQTVAYHQIKATDDDEHEKKCPKKSSSSLCWMLRGRNKKKKKTNKTNEWAKCAKDEKYIYEINNSERQKRVPTNVAGTKENQRNNDQHSVRCVHCSVSFCAVAITKQKPWQFFKQLINEHRTSECRICWSLSFSQLVCKTAYTRKRGKNIVLLISYTFTKLCYFSDAFVSTQFYSINDQFTHVTRFHHIFRRHNIFGCQLFVEM